MTHGIPALTGFMKNTGVAGVFVYGFFKKSLIPTGLHHFVWSPSQLIQISDTLNVDGQMVSGARAISLIYMCHPDLTPVMNNALRSSQQGITTIFGLVDVSLTFCHTAKPEKKVTAKAVLLPAAITSMLTGITEPIEFTFLFVSPLLWMIHAMLTVTSQAICDVFTVRPWGASDLIEFLTHNPLLPVSLTRWPGYALTDTGQFAVYYVTFCTLVVRLNLKTSDREDDKNVKFYSKAEYRQEVAQPRSVTDDIIRGLGGKENILFVDNCFTRLRVAVRDMTLVDDAQLKNAGANGVVRNHNEAQVIYGIKVGQVYSWANNWLTEN